MEITREYLSAIYQLGTVIAWIVYLGAFLHAYGLYREGARPVRTDWQRGYLRGCLASGGILLLFTTTMVLGGFGPVD